MIASRLEDGYPIKLNNIQRESLQSLDDFLRLQADQDQLGVDIIRRVLVELYFLQKDLKALTNAFYSPLIAYSAIKCLDQAGGYIPPYRYTIHLAKLQFSMRLNGFRYLDAVLSNARKQQSHEDNHWIQ